MIGPNATDIHLSISVSAALGHQHQQQQQPKTFSFSSPSHMTMIHSRAQLPPLRHGRPFNTRPPSLVTGPTSVCQRMPGIRDNLTWKQCERDKHTHTPRPDDLYVKQGHEKRDEIPREEQTEKTRRTPDIHLTSLPGSGPIIVLQKTWPSLVAPFDYLPLQSGPCSNANTPGQ